MRDEAMQAKNKIDTPQNITSSRHGTERGYFTELFETSLWVIGVYLAATLLTARFVVEGPSMQPTLETGQFLLVDRLGYWLGTPEYGDLIVFHYPENPSDDYVKRVVGLPGDTVEMTSTRLLVNETEVQETYLNEPCASERCEDNRWTLAGDEYFVLGDNRNFSQDSRAFGPVERHHIIGEAWICYWPPSDWRLLRR